MTGSIIVVGVDGSETAFRAAETARSIAQALNSTLHVVTAFDSDRTEVIGSGSDRWVVSDADAAEQIAGKVASQLATPGQKITYAAARGKPAEALVNEAELQDAKMIVVGNRRMQGLGRCWQRCKQCGSQRALRCVHCEDRRGAITPDAVGDDGRSEYVRLSASAVPHSTRFTSAVQSASAGRNPPSARTLTVRSEVRVERGIAIRSRSAEGGRKGRYWNGVVLQRLRWTGHPD